MLTILRKSLTFRSIPGFCSEDGDEVIFTVRSKDRFPTQVQPIQTRAPLHPRTGEARRIDSFANGSNDG